MNRSYYTLMAGLNLSVSPRRSVQHHAILLDQTGR